jgi:glycosyl transferase family 87
MLAPLALVPKAWLAPVSAAITLSVSPLLAYLVVRSICPRARPAAALVPTLLFLCWGGVRTLLEFSRLSMTLAFLASIHANARPVASGVSLGLALAKPHIAGPMMLWAIFTRRTRLVAVAVTVVAALFALYCARADVGPADVVGGYTRILLSFYSGAEALVGRTSLRPWWTALAGHHVLGDILWGVGALLLLIVPCGIALRDSNVSDVRAAAAPALFCLWSLLTIYHIGNNLILLLPAFAFLLLSDDPATVWWRMGVASAIQIAMMLDIPVHLASRVPDHGVLFLLVRDVDRIVVLVTFVSVALLWRRQSQSPSN